MMAGWLVGDITTLPCVRRLSTSSLISALAAIMSESPPAMDHTNPAPPPAPPREASATHRARGTTPRKAAQTPFRILPLSANPAADPTPAPDTSTTSTARPPTPLRTARESRQQYRERGLTPRKVSAGNRGIPLLADSAPRDTPAPVQQETTQEERDRRDRRLFRQHGTPRKVADAGFCIEPLVGEKHQRGVGK